MNTMSEQETGDESERRVYNFWLYMSHEWRVIAETKGAEARHLKDNHKQMRSGPTAEGRSIGNRKTNASIKTYG